MTDIESNDNGQYIYSEQCPVCGEHVSVTVPTEVEDIAQARLRMELHEHLREHGKIELAVGWIRAYCREQYLRAKKRYYEWRQ